MVWRKADAAMRRVLNTTLPNSFLSSLPDDARNLEVCVVWQHLEPEPSAERKESEVREGPRKGDDGGDDDFTAEKVEIALNKLFGDKSKKAIIGQSEASLVTRINHVKKGTKKRKLDANANVQGQGCFNCHQKAQCECMKADRDPSREGGGRLQNQHSGSTVEKVAKQYHGGCYDTARGKEATDGARTTNGRRSGR
ncbi:hypothetical protein PC121_g593 [Phytophthora cactorum]|nr:hypothetical protein PC120_g9904 [Phytophthora cactorum]KAG3104874.1 hypothetical protein PC121_g593 [Phytophthora cactorum]